MRLNPAKTVIEICGGIRETARLCNRHPTRVSRWQRSKSSGGTGGLVPSNCAQVLLSNARAEGIDLRPEHFFNAEAVCQPVEDGA